MLDFIENRVYKIRPPVKHQKPDWTSKNDAWGQPGGQANKWSLHRLITVEISKRSDCWISGSSVPKKLKSVLLRTSAYNEKLNCSPFPISRFYLFLLQALDTHTSESYIRSPIHWWSNANFSWKREVNSASVNSGTGEDKPSGNIMKRLKTVDLK